ncbi:hypothetical protein OAA91_01385, partial [Fibrobacterales bacterium]|nr:hypothetical protein [Fibrobacterales bacterium]
PNFQTRFTLVFSEQPWSGASQKTTQLGVGESSTLGLTKGNGMHESISIIKGDSLIVEIF